MKIDMREHLVIREQVHAGMSALRVQGRQIWGDTKLTPIQIVVRLMVGVGDLARIARSIRHQTQVPIQDIPELKKELGNIIFSTIRWVDDLGFDVLECLERAIDAQEKFVESGKPR